MYRKYEDVIINLSQIQSVRPKDEIIEVIFINGAKVTIKTHKFDWITNHAGRITNAEYEKYDECIKKWQIETVNEIFNELNINVKKVF